MTQIEISMFHKDMKYQILETYQNIIYIFVLRLLCEVAFH